MTTSALNSNQVGPRLRRPMIALPTEPDARRNWAVIFIVLTVLFEIGLFLLGDTPFRLPLRIGCFALSLGFLVFLPRPLFSGITTNPAARWVWVVALLLCIEFLNPSGDTLLARVAIIFLYLSVLAPVIWVGRLKISAKTFRLVVLITWSFSTLSTSVGVLQIEFPGQFEGATNENFDENALKSHTFTLASGEQIVQPKGLSDSPGGASSAGVNAIILGTGLLLTERRWIWRLLSVGGMLAGLFCIYICQGRSALIILGVSELTLLFVLIRRKIIGRALLVSAVLIGVAVVGTIAAFAVGGQETIDRWYTMIAEDPNTLYQHNRGQFLAQMLDYDIWSYPFGAGEGRWGMMNLYFGNVNNSLWAEMQWQALLYDGGIALILVYIALLASLVWTAIQVATNSMSNDLACWAAIIIGYTLSAIVASFSFPFFCHPVGIQLMLLNACLYSIFQTENRAPLIIAGGARKHPYGSGFPASGTRLTPLRLNSH